MTYQDSLNELKKVVAEVEAGLTEGVIYPSELRNIKSVYGLLTEQNAIMDELGLALIGELSRAAETGRYLEKPKGRGLVLRAVEVIGRVLKDKILEERTLERRV